MKTMEQHQPLQYFSSSCLNSSYLRNLDICCQLTHKFNYYTSDNTRSLDTHVLIYMRSLSRSKDDYMSINCKSVPIQICLPCTLKHFKIIFIEITCQTELPTWISSTSSYILMVYKCVCLYTELSSLINMSKRMLWALRFSSLHTELILSYLWYFDCIVCYHLCSQCDMCFANFLTFTAISTFEDDSITLSKNVGHPVTQILQEWKPNMYYA